MISHPQTLFSIIVTEKQNQTKLDQSFSTPRIFECKHHIIFELKEHTLITAAHFKTIHDRHFLIQSKSLSKKKRKERKSKGIFNADIIFSLKGRNSQTLQLIISRHHKDPFLIQSKSLPLNI